MQVVYNNCDLFDGSQNTGHVLTDTTGDGRVTITYEADYNLTWLTDRKGDTYSYGSVKNLSLF